MAIRNAFPLTLLVGLAGGFLAWSVGSPIPWLLGSLCATVIAAQTRLPLGSISKHGSRWLRVVIGVSLGAYVIKILEQMAWHYWAAILLALVFTVVATAFGAALFRRTLALSPRDSFLSALPGGLSYLIALAGDHGQRFPQIGLIHTVRVVTLVFAFSLLAAAVGANAHHASLAETFHLDAHPERLLLIATVLLSGWLADLSRISGSHTVFGLVISAAAYHFGWLSLPVPELWITLSMVLLGILLGVEITRDSDTRYTRTVLISVAFTLSLTAIASIMAWPLSLAYNGHFLLFLLALAPGGIAEISLIALSLGLDVGLVALAHASRFIFILALGPTGLRYYARHPDHEPSDHQP